MVFVFTAALATALAGASSADDERALYFGAPGSVLTVDDPALPAEATELTVEFRFKTLSKSRRSAKVISRWTPIPGSKDPDKGAFFVEVGAGKIVFGVRNASGVTKSITGRTSWKVGTWHHVAGVFDNGTATIYIDGYHEAPVNLGSTYGSGNVRYGFVGVGSEATDFNGAQTTNFFIGDLDDVRIYQRALSAAEVAGMAGRTDPFEQP